MSQLGMKWTNEKQLHRNEIYLKISEKLQVIELPDKTA